MKLIVKNTFRDKFDRVTEYAQGQVLEVEDESRAADLVERGLCAEYKGKKAVNVRLRLLTGDPAKASPSADAGEGVGAE